MPNIKKKLMIISGVMLIALPAAPALAEGTGDSTSNRTTSSAITEKANQKKAELQAQHDKQQAERQQKLQESKQKKCQEKQADINNRLKKIAERGQKQLELFSNIATKTETFYTTKNLSVSNYDTLVSAINDKKAAAQATVDKITSDSTTFTCDDTTTAKSQLAGFKTDLKAEISALKEYRTSVKNLIVAVKSAAGQSQEQTNANG
jgi:hypothetical protein